MLTAPLSIRSRFLVIAAALVTIPALILAFANTADARVKVKSGVYYQAPKKTGSPSGYITTDGGKVTGGYAEVKFKDKSGKKCVPEGTYENNGRVGIGFQAKKPKKPDSNNSFSIKSDPATTLAGLKASVSGKFKSSKKAKLRFTAKAGGCSAKLNLNKAKFRAGG